MVTGAQQRHALDAEHSEVPSLEIALSGNVLVQSWPVEVAVTEIPAQTDAGHLGRGAVKTQPKARGTRLETLTDLITHVCHRFVIQLGVLG